MGLMPRLGPPSPCLSKPCMSRSPVPPLQHTQHSAALNADDLMGASRSAPGRHHGARIASTLGLLLIVAGGVSSNSSSDRALWGRRQDGAAEAAGLLKPSRPERPKHPNNATDPHSPNNGVVPGIFVESFTGLASTVPVDQLPDVKPDGVPRDPAYRAAKAAWKVRVLNGRTGCMTYRSIDISIDLNLKYRGSCELCFHPAD